MMQMMDILEDFLHDFHDVRSEVPDFASPAKPVDQPANATFSDADESECMPQVDMDSSPVHNGIPEALVDIGFASSGEDAMPDTRPTIPFYRLVIDPCV